MIPRRQFLKISAGTVASQFGLRVLPCALLRPVGDYPHVLTLS